VPQDSLTLNERGGEERRMEEREGRGREWQHVIFNFSLE